jgi:predicted MFS family arabinose efflux permease
MARFGRRQTFVLGCLGMAAGMLPLALVPHWAAAGIGFVVVYMMAFTVDAAFNTFSQGAVAPGWRSTVSGVAFTAEGLSRMLIGLGGGRAIADLGYGPFFLIVAALPATAALLFWAYFRGPRGEAADQPVPETS